MRRRLLLVSALMLVMGLAFPGPASASTAADCQAMIAGAGGLIETTHAGVFSNAKDQTGLVAKAEAAAAKLDVVKIADARQKLVDYRATLDALAAARKPKVESATYDILSAAVMNAIGCIDDLS